jgi:hypothetical protein
MSSVFINKCVMNPAYFYLETVQGLACQEENPALEITLCQSETARRSVSPP